MTVCLVRFATYQALICSYSDIWRIMSDGKSQSEIEIFLGVSYCIYRFI